MDKINFCCYINAATFQCTAFLVLVLFRKREFPQSRAESYALASCIWCELLNSMSNSSMKKATPNKACKVVILFSPSLFRKDYSFLVFVYLEKTILS